MTTGEVFEKIIAQATEALRTYQTGEAVTFVAHPTPDANPLACVTSPRARVAG